MAQAPAPSPARPPTGTGTHPRGVATIAWLIALTAMPCAAVARSASKGCGGASRAAARTGARGADDWVSAASIRNMRSGSMRTGSMRAGAAMSADDLARLGLDDGLVTATKAADDAALGKFAEHSLDAPDLTELAMGPDEELDAATIESFGYANPGAVDPDARAPLFDVMYMSTLDPAGPRADPAVAELFATTRELRGVIDASRSTPEGLASSLRLAPTRALVLMAPEVEPSDDAGATTIGYGTPEGESMSRRASVLDFARACVNPERACYVLGCPADAQLRCGLAAFDLALACEQREDGLADCLRKRGDHDAAGPSVTIAFMHEGELKIIRSRRDPKARRPRTPAP